MYIKGKIYNFTKAGQSWMKTAVKSMLKGDEDKGFVGPDGYMRHAAWHWLPEGTGRGHGTGSVQLEQCVERVGCSSQVAKT